MIRIKNTHSKEYFEKYLESEGIKIKPLDIISKVKKGWEISNIFGNTYRIIFTGNVNEYQIFNVLNYETDKPFRVDILSCNRCVDICYVWINGKRYKSDRWARGYKDLASFVNDLLYFRYLK